MKKASFLRTASVLLFSVALLFGCSSGSGSGSGSGTPAASNGGTTPGAPQKDQMVIAVNENFITMDPQNTGDALSSGVQSAMFEGLLIYDKDLKLTPGLSTEYSVNENATEYTFKLRQNVKFHDGTPFNAEAVKINFDRMSNKDNNLRAYRNYKYIKSTEVVDEHTVKVTLNQPFSAMINKFTTGIISPAALEKYGKDITKNPVGTGPYKFVEWVQGDHLTVELNPDHWNKGAAKVGKIVYKPVPENGSRVAMLKTGEADVIYPLPEQQVETLNGEEGVKVERTPSTITRYVSINMLKKPFDDPRVRQAINHAVDKDAFIKVVKSGYGAQLESVMSPTIAHYAKQGAYEYNIEKAKQLLKEAGYENGFTTDIWGNTNSDTMKGMQFIQQQLQKVGITVEVKSMEEATLSDEIYGIKSPEEAKMNMWYVSWSSADPDNAMRSLFSSENFPPAGANTAFYKNDLVDQSIKEATQSSDQDKQKQLYGVVQENVFKDAPWIFLAVDEILYGKRANVNGVYITPSGGIYVREAAFQ
ncbi:glutathione ABC transporter substrate-binding protein [Brevibacillus porteri]|uniref:glutathione ABC transporter substrate-binding protein n=1 Tax=Brevibacillus porteri TaxID=2126350 RepID=UPI00370A89FC